ncbi:unnamed protein product [[Candida] boidinii]|uniref:Unnamed protein product n=1 Tax=Candida boidinii TaxID=5477 RepID=A0A9W6T8V6_CANBO|nr:unnamed protein product [[Candida] boidinii]
MVTGAVHVAHGTVVVNVETGVETITSGTVTGAVPVVMTVSVVMVTGPVHVAHGTVVVTVETGVDTMISTTV